MGMITGLRVLLCITDNRRQRAATLHHPLVSVDDQLQQVINYDDDKLLLND